jgi:hypothetical protein
VWTSAAGTLPVPAPMTGLWREAPLSYGSEAEVNLCACVGGVVQTLKPECHSALERIDLGGESIADVAQAESITRNSAPVRLHRARRAAKKLIQVCGAYADHTCLDCTCKHQV